MGVYKFRSTASGTPPTDEDLFRTITRGLPGSNMPDWQHLDEATRWHLVDYLKSLSPVFAESAPEPVAAAPDPGPGRADLAKGRAVYEQLQCAACHGASGRANGMSAAGLVDDWGKPIRPANLTQGWNFRGWSEPEDIMLRMLTGIDGAGMPAYAGAVSPEDAWHLAYYVASLQEPAAWHRIARAARLPGALPVSGDDPRWAHAETTTVRLRNAVSAEGEWVEPPTVSAVSVQAAYNEDAIAWCLRWDDPTEDAADRFAILLKPAGAQGDVVSLQAWPTEGGPALSLVLWDPKTAGREAVSRSFDVGETVRLPHAAGSYDDGRWELIVHRPLQPGQAGAAVITPGELASIAFAAWDGGRAGARAVSPWFDVDLGAGQHAGAEH
jgi:DMSO reductase family type II enzyme heme b subunit